MADTGSAAGGGWRRLAAGFLAYGLGDFLLFGLNFFVLLPALTRHLSPADYGTVASLNALGLVLLSLMQFGLPSTVFRYFFLYEEGEPRGAYFGTIWLFALALAAAVSCLLVLFGEGVWGMVMREAPFAVYAPYVVWGAFCQLSFIFATVLLRARECPRAFVALNLAQFLCLCANVVYRVVVLKEGALGQVRGAFETYALFAVVSAVILLRYVRLRPRRQHLAQSIPFAAPVFATYLIGFFVSRANVLILQYFVAGGAVGVFALGSQISNVIYLLSAACDKVWQPMLYQLEEMAAREALSRYLRYATVFYTFAALAMGLFSAQVVALLSSRSYAGAWSVVAITGVASACVAISSVPVGGIYYARRSSAVAWITAVCAALNLGLSALAIPRWGMLGSCWVSLAVGFATLALSIVALRRYVGVAVDVRNLAGCALLGMGILAAGCWVADGVLKLPPLSALALKSAGVAGYAAALWVLRIFPAREDEGIRLYCHGFFRSVHHKTEGAS